MANGVIGRIGLGGMRLSTISARDDERSIEVLHAAFDAGVTLLDTSDAYCHDETDTGHNERLIARAVDEWGGDRESILVATKGGLTRPGGRWVPDGRAKHLVAACEASLSALGVERIELYQLHAVDPQTPLGTSVRALARLRKSGKVRDIGLCNVTVGQIAEARTITDIASVQVEFSAVHDDAIRGGVVDYCRQHDIALIAHSPLGSPRRIARLLANGVVAALASELGRQPAEILLAWLKSLGPNIVPIPGASRPETAEGAARGQLLTLDGAMRARMDQLLPTTHLVRTRREDRRPPDDARGEVVLIMGYPGAGKSTLARSLIDASYRRLNRDEMGGKLRGLARALESELQQGGRHFVLDNTYPTRRARNDVIEAAWRHGVPARCVWLTTSLEQSQLNTIRRMLRRHGHLLSPEEMKMANTEDPNAFPPRAQFDFRRKLEPPVVEEGFTRVDLVDFEAHATDAYDRRAVLFDFDVVWKSRSGGRSPRDPEDVELLPGRAAALGRFATDGYQLLGTAWRPEVGAGKMAPDLAEACFVRANELLGVKIVASYCPHTTGPSICWCRRPLPGLGLALLERHRVDPAKSLYIGKQTDESHAARLGLPFEAAETTFRRSV